MSEPGEKSEKKAELQGAIFSSFFLEKTEFAIDVDCVQEVINYPTTLTPMPLAPDFLLGVFNLRGSIIPIVNLKRLLKFESVTNFATGKVAIIDHHGAKVGLIFDSTSEILRSRNHDLSDFHYRDEAQHGVVKGVLKLEGGARLIQVLDPERLIQIENLPQVQADPNHSSKKDNRRQHLHSLRKKCITFSVGRLRMSFEIRDIHEIVKVPEIKNSALESNLCAGLIHIREQVIPVIHFAKLLGETGAGQGVVSDRRIIVLKIDREFFGLLVDAVESIDSYDESAIMAIPLLSKARIQMFDGCISVPEKGEVFLLNHQMILSHDEIIAVTHGHSQIYQSKHAETSDLISRKKERRVFLSFKLNHFFGIPIKDVKEIIDFSAKIVKVPGAPSFVRGVINLRGKLVSVIDTRAVYKIERDATISEVNQKILVFQRGQEQFGLIVDSVESILTLDAKSNLKIPDLFLNMKDGVLKQDISEILETSTVAEKSSALIVLNVFALIDRIQAGKAA